MAVHGDVYQEAMADKEEEIHGEEERSLGDDQMCAISWRCSYMILFVDVACLYG